MLVLSRRSAEQICLPGLNVRITILRVRTGRVQLGIEAPPEIEISRPDAVTEPPRVGGTDRPPSGGEI